MRTTVLLSVFFGVFLGLSLSCGKVVQDVTPKKEAPLYTLKAVLPVISTADVAALAESHPTLAVQQYLTPLVSPLYVHVAGLGEDGAFRSLSWGKSTLLSEPILASAQAVSTNGVSKLRYVSTSFRPDGVKLTGSSDHKWSKMVFNDAAFRWELESRKLKRGLPYYMLQAYGHADQYYLRVFDAKTVSNNLSVDLTEVTAYDTFLSTLFLASLQTGRDILDIRAYFDGVAALFDRSFFDMLYYESPKNQVRKFSVAAPQFVFLGEREKTLLALYDLFRSDADEAVLYLEGLKVSWLSLSAKQYLKARIVSRSQPVLKGGSIGGNAS